MGIRHLLQKIIPKRPPVNAEQELRATLLKIARGELNEKWVRANGSDAKISWLNKNISQCRQELEKISESTLRIMLRASLNPNYLVIDYICKPIVPDTTAIRNIALFFNILDSSHINPDRYEWFVEYSIEVLRVTNVVRYHHLTEREEVIAKSILGVSARCYREGNYRDAQALVNESVVAVLAANPELADELIDYIDRIGSPALADVDAHRFMLVRSAPVAALAEGIL